MNAKKIICTLLFVVSLSLNIFANQYTTDYTISNTNEIFEVTGTLPLANTGFSSLDTDLNENITETYNKKISNAKNASVSKLDFSYEEKISSDYVSILLYTKSTNLGTTTYVDTFVFNKNTGNLVDIEDFSDLLPKEISEYTSTGSYSNKFFSSNVLSNNQINFYVEDDKIVLISTVGGQLTFKDIEFSEVCSFRIKKNDYYTKGTYQIMMVPLRTLLEGLGYDISYTSTDEPINISKNDDFFAITIDDKTYANNGKSTTLEVSPELIDGSTYVPITFVTDVMNIDYKANSDGSFTFSIVE